MRHLAPALLACVVTLAASAQPATALTSVGVSVGLAQLDPAKPASFESYHTTSNVRFRWEALSPYTDMTFGIVSRAQALDGTHNYVFETSGLALSAGGRLGFFRAGLGLEAAWLRQIVQDPNTPGTLKFHNGGGFVVEPYAGVILPFLKSDVTELEISVHYPLAALKPDPAIGPRVLLTLWLGGEGGDDEDETDEEDKEDQPEMPGEAPSTEPSAAPVVPAPRPSAKPSKKPALKPAARSRTR